MTTRRKRRTNDTTPRLSEGTDGHTVAIFLRRPSAPPTEREQLGNAFLRWAWEAQFGSWEDAVRALARTLRGLERTGLIERHTLRCPGEPPRHCVTLTEDGLDLLATLSGTSAGGER